MSLQDPQSVVRPGGIIIRSRPNWFVGLFLGALGLVHLLNAMAGADGGGKQFGLALAGLFLVTGVAAAFVTHEVRIGDGAECVTIRWGTRRWGRERRIGFDQVQKVRLTLHGTGPDSEARIELLCEDQTIECPPTRFPRQFALSMAIRMGVPLVRISNGPQGHKNRIADFAA